MCNSVCFVLNFQRNARLALIDRITFAANLIETDRETRNNVEKSIEAVRLIEASLSALDVLARSNLSWFLRTRAPVLEDPLHRCLPSRPNSEALVLPTRKSNFHLDPETTFETWNTPPPFTSAQFCCLLHSWWSLARKTWIVRKFTAIF